MIPPPDNPLIVALDVSDLDRAEALAAELAGGAGMLKVGLELFWAHGPDAVRRIARHAPVFVDAKLHDIPAQIEGAMTSIAQLGASYVTVHAAGGFDMVKAAVGASSEGLRVLAVTVLTSLDDAELDRLGLGTTTEDAVLRLAERALDAGADGLVCSPLELAAVRKRFGDSPDLVVPGIRPPGAGTDDQRRTLGPREALDAGATLLVVGRPITAAPDPSAAARAMLESLRPRPPRE